jgi:hypothetical protein
MEMILSYPCRIMELGFLQKGFLKFFLYPAGFMGILKGRALVYFLQKNSRCFRWKYYFGK